MEIYDRRARYSEEAVSSEERTTVGDITSHRERKANVSGSRFSGWAWANETASYDWMDEYAPDFGAHVGKCANWLTLHP